MCLPIPRTVVAGTTGCSRARVRTAATARARVGATTSTAFTRSRAEATASVREIIDATAGTGASMMPSLMTQTRVKSGGRRIALGNGCESTHTFPKKGKSTSGIGAPERHCSFTSPGDHRSPKASERGAVKSRQQTLVENAFRLAILRVSLPPIKMWNVACF